MANILMTVGLIGMVIGVIAPVFRVLNKKSKTTKWQVILVLISILIFILGVVIGLS